MSKLTDKQYNTKLAAFIKSSTTQRDNCQVLIVEGIQQYLDSGRTTRLSTFLSKSVKVKSLPTVTIKDFIKSYTNLKYSKNKAGDYMFLKDDKSTTISSLPTENWYEWNKAKHNSVKEIDYTKRLTNDVKKALEKGVAPQDLMSALLDGGLTTKQLLNMIETNTAALGIAV